MDNYVEEASETAHMQRKRSFKLKTRTNRKGNRKGGPRQAFEMSQSKVWLLLTLPRSGLP